MGLMEIKLTLAKALAFSPGLNSSRFIYRQLCDHTVVVVLVSGQISSFI